MTNPKPSSKGDLTKTTDENKIKTEMSDDELNAVTGGTGSTTPAIGKPKPADFSFAHLYDKSS